MRGSGHKFLTEDLQFLGRFDSEPHSGAVHLEKGDGHGVSDLDPLARLARKHEHVAPPMRGHG
jgi:hypothetical protein